MSDRLPPHDAAAEAALLGCILLNPATMNDALSLGADQGWFYDPRHGLVFNAMRCMIDELVPVDLVTLHGRLKQVDLTFLSSLTDATPSAANLPHYCAIVMNCWTKRRVIQAATEIIDAAYSDSTKGSDVTELMENRTMAIGQAGIRKDIVSMRDLVNQVSYVIEERHKGKTDAMATGFIDLDSYTTGGLRRGEMWVLAARPNCGKTSLAMNIATNVAERFRRDWEEKNQPGTPYSGDSVGVFSLEMTAIDLAERAIASKGRVSTRISAGELVHPDGSPTEKGRKMAVASVAVSKLPIIIDDTAPLSVTQIRARARRYFMKYRVKLFIVDYLQLAAPDLTIADADRRVQVDAISMGLKNLAKELNVPIIVVSQLNREMDKGPSRRPRLSDLRESGQIEQDADLVGILFSEDHPNRVYDTEEPREIKLRIAKQRNGPKDVDVDLVFTPHIVRFDNAAKVSFRP